ncbi:hypothetical protein AVEN_155532-1 [Araneus ventricosus]|uniref:Uncharacterized protein n=1 Tax=Araneus ventricosus TaxID=182803 RepID=A0A4Y2SK97_ARAVE|nr:hypothetical protein AVEN_155532-1 [Araneus ventricosus]
MPRLRRILSDSRYRRSSQCLRKKVRHSQRPGRRQRRRASLGIEMHCAQDTGAENQSFLNRFCSSRQQHGGAARRVAEILESAREAWNETLS